MQVSVFTTTICVDVVHPLIVQKIPDYMVHQYGSNDNWDRMAKVTGDPGWAWGNMRQYILRVRDSTSSEMNRTESGYNKHEMFVNPNDGHDPSSEFQGDLHSFVGDVKVTVYGKSQNIDARVIRTTKELTEFPYSKDVSGIAPDLLGVGFAQSTMSGGARVSSSTTYSNAVKTRPNLTVLINAMVTKLINTGVLDGLTGFRKVEFTDGRLRSGIVSVYLFYSPAH